MSEQCKLPNNNIINIQKYKIQNTIYWILSSLILQYKVKIYTNNSIF